MEILSGSQMREVDRHAIDGLGIPSLLLMEAAGRGVAEALLADYPDAARDGVLVLCGKGNNGGDGLVAARHLAWRGLSPRIVLLARADELTGDCAVNLRVARAQGLDVEEIADEAAWQAARGRLARRGLVLDALLGTGIRGGARGLVGRAIDDLNAWRARVVAVDLPSGLDGDSAEVAGSAVHAERTYTLCRPKIPLVFAPAAAHAGAWRVVRIGIPDAAVAAQRPALEWMDAAAASRLLEPRAQDSHKGSYGHLLAVAASRGKSGAAVLLGRAALRAGVGLCTAATPAGVQASVAAQHAELMTEPLPETAGGELDATAAGPIRERLARVDAMAIGPGLGTATATAEATLAVLAAATLPAVLDADALNILADHPETLTGLAERRPPWVLTPHPGEAARLLGSDARSVQRDRLRSVRELTRRSGAVVVLKGHRSLVATTAGRVTVNGSGNPGMATAGSGDVLTGVVGAFLARGLDPADAARLAVFVHGAAGDRAAADQGQEGLVASDIIEHLPGVLHRLSRRAEASGRTR